MTHDSPLDTSKDAQSQSIEDLALQPLTAPIPLNPPISRKDRRGTNAVEARTEAEAIASSMETRVADDPENLSLDEIRRALHELRVHEIELASQNDELRRTQIELDAARARYFELFDLAPVGYCSLNDHELILEANLTAAALLGVPRGVLVKQPITRFIIGDSRDDFYFHRKELFATGTPQAWKLHMVKNDGTAFWAWIEATVIKSSVGTPVCHIALIDITERLNAELANQRSEEALRQTQKVEGIGILASGIAHDFNNLLNAMIGQSDLAIRKLPKSSPARNHVEKTIKAAERAADLARHLLSYSGKNKFVNTIIDLNTMVKDNVQMLATSVPKTAHLRYELDSSPPPRILGDVGQIQQVIMNFIINAGEAMGPNPGTITLRTRRIELRNKDTENWNRTSTPLTPGRYVKLQISDNGCGMTSEQAKRIFDPFFTTKFTGRGLGLSAVLGIIQGHHGGIRIQSQEGKGTQFEIVFPIVDDDTAPEIQKETPASAIDGNNKTVLVIDDDPSVLELLTDIFTEANFSLLTAANSMEGIELYRTHQDGIAAVILDYSMPGMDGKAAFEELIKINGNVKVLLCSGYMEDEMRSAFGVVRPNEFMHKPYRPASLLDRVSRMLSEVSTT